MISEERKIVTAFHWLNKIVSWGYEITIARDLKTKQISAVFELAGYDESVCYVLYDTRMVDLIQKCYKKCVEIAMEKYPLGEPNDER